VSEAIIAENNAPAIVGALSARGILLIPVVMIGSDPPGFAAAAGAEFPDRSPRAKPAPQHAWAASAQGFRRLNRLFGQKPLAG